MESFIGKRATEAAGMLLILAGLFLALSVATYHPGDASLNLAASAPVQNAGGSFGAYIADPLLQLFGLGVIPLIFILPVWGWKLATKSAMPSIWKRLPLTMLLLPAASGLASLLDLLAATPESWPAPGFGGVTGQAIMSAFQPAIGLWAYAAIFTIAAASLLFFSAGLSWGQWRTGGKYAYRTGAIIARAIADLAWRLRALLERQGATDAAHDTAPATAPQKKRRIVSKQETKNAAVQTSLDVTMHEDFQLPPMTLLRHVTRKLRAEFAESALLQNAEMLEKVLDDFGVNGKIAEVRPGPVVTLYALEPSPGTKSSRVIGLADDIARSMSAVSARISVIPGQNAIGIELPNATRETVYLRELLETDSYKRSEDKLPLVLGKDISGNPIVIDLARTPHLLVAGTTGSGKSVGLNAMILSLLYKYSPDECKFIMIDPKMLELSVYQNIPHLLAPVVTEPGKAVVALKWTVKEMENRYRLMSNLGVRNVQGYNQKILEARKSGEKLTRAVQTGFDADTGQPVIEKVPLDMNPLPFIVVIVDEMADLMLVAGKDIETSVQRLAQMARAAGIHIILATQRPSVDVITGVIKANFPTRISFQVTSRIDSRTILGEQGAEQLLGMGDMLYMAGGGKIIRVHGPFVEDKEVERVAEFLRGQGKPDYVEAVTVDDSEDSAASEEGGGSGDDLYDQAVAIVCRDGKASTSYVQRALKIGYNRAATIIERMEREGVISPPSHSGRREVLAGQQ